MFKAYRQRLVEVEDGFETRPAGFIYSLSKYSIYKKLNSLLEEREVGSRTYTEAIGGIEFVTVTEHFHKILSDTSLEKPVSSAAPHLGRTHSGDLGV